MKREKEEQLDEKKYYVYQHINIDNGEVFYVGQGSGNRATVVHNRTDAWFEYVRNNPNWMVKITDKNLTKYESILKENEYILSIGRIILKTGTLVNILTNNSNKETMSLKTETETIRISSSLKKRLDERMMEMGLRTYPALMEEFLKLTERDPEYKADYNFYTDLQNK